MPSLSRSVRTIGSAFLTNTPAYGVSAVRSPFRLRTVRTEGHTHVLHGCHPHQMQERYERYRYHRSWLRSYHSTTNELFCALDATSSPVHSKSGSYPYIPDLYLAYFSELRKQARLLCKLAENFVQKCFCHIISVSVCCFYFAVSLIRVYTKCNVGWQVSMVLWSMPGNMHPRRSP